MVKSYLSYYVDWLDTCFEREAIYKIGDTLLETTLMVDLKCPSNALGFSLY